MLGLKIFVQVQTFRRRPFVPLHNFCHPVTIQISFYSSLWWASAATKSSLVGLEREEFRRLATTGSRAESYSADCCLATSWRHFQPDVVQRRGGFTRLARADLGFWDWRNLLPTLTCHTLTHSMKWLSHHFQQICRDMLTILNNKMKSLVWRQQLVSFSNLSIPVLK